MHYPFLLFSPFVRLQPIFPGLAGEPFLLDLSPNSPLLRGLDLRDQKGFQHLLDQQMRPDHQWGLAAYLERRDTLLADCPQMVAEQRYFHLGLDIIVGLGTPLHAPLDAVVEESGYERGEGNYGGYVLLRHHSPRFTTFYSFYGHLRKDRLPKAGTLQPAGTPFAEIGDFHENGNWFYHTHFQILTEEGRRRGYISKGYCNRETLADLSGLCPDPLPLFTTG